MRASLSRTSLRASLPSRSCGGGVSLSISFKTAAASFAGSPSSAAPPLARLADRIEKLVIVCDCPIAAHHGASGPIGAERAGAERGHMHPERRHLRAHHFGDALKSEFAAAVIGDAGHCDRPPIDVT